MRIRVLVPVFYAVCAMCALLVLPSCTSEVHQSRTGASSGVYTNASSHSRQAGSGQSSISAPPLPASRFGAHTSDGLSFAADEEIWVIQRPVIDQNASHTAQHADQSTDPGGGSMLCRTVANNTNKVIDIPVPLEHTNVSANIHGWIASVDVTQQFRNPFDEAIEAVYLFPLPANAAINEFVMTIGERRIRGIIREREEAMRVYEAAKAAGHMASLLNEHRPNVFEQKVANIEPGKRIDVDIRYFHTLTWSDGWFEFVFPMVVGPRFNPPGFTDGIGAVARGNSPSAQRTAAEYLRPSERSGHDIAVDISIDAGVSIERVESLSHVVRVNQNAGSRDKARVQLSANDRIPNRDFVLRYKVAGDRMKSVLLTHKNDTGRGVDRGGYFMLMLVPPEKLNSLDRTPVEMVFVLDSSGSMRGAPIEQARSAIERGLAHLRPEDSFQIINFADTSSKLGPQPLDATPANIERGRRHAKQVQSGGGTIMLNGINAALGYDSGSYTEHQRLRFVTFLTDGYIGNEQQILRAVHDNLGEARVFSFGVGQAPNRFLMDGMARAGRGAVAYLSLDDSANVVMDMFFERISHPALTDVHTRFLPSAQVRDVYPQRIPDLFVGRPIIITGRYDGTLDGPVTITGRAGNEQVSLSVPVRTFGTGTQAENGALPTIWARMKIAELMRQMWLYGEDTTREVGAIALEHGLMSQFTSFVAVDAFTRTERGSKTVVVPVPVPDGVSFDTAVGHGG